MRKLIVFSVTFFALIFNFVSGYVTINHEENCGDNDKDNNYALICYFTDWAVYREGKGKFTPENVDPKLCTHIVYAFALLDESLDKIVPADPNADIDKGFYAAITSFKEKGIWVVLSLGGWNESTEKYSKMLKDTQHRANVVAHMSSFLREHKFQGCDLDVEYPAAYQGEIGTGVPEDKENFAKFLCELRQKFDEDYEKGLFPERPTLSVAVSGNSSIVDVAYDVPTIAKTCDWIGVMTYDLRTQGDGRTGLVAPFDVQPGDEGKYLEANVQAMMKFWLDKGAPANKLVTGVPFYGRTFHLTDKCQTGINAPAAGEAEPGEFTKSPNTLAFYEIVDNVRNKGWTVVHKENLGSYAFKDAQWAGYDDKRDVAVKADYIKKNCFFGAMIWALDHDCFQQDFPDGPYPLLTTLKNVLAGKEELTTIKNVT